MSDLIRKMVGAYEAHRTCIKIEPHEHAMRAALAVLADNVTDEMAGAALTRWLSGLDKGDMREWHRSAIAAAIREAGK